MKRTLLIAVIVVLGAWSAMPQRGPSGTAKVSSVDSVRFKVGNELGWALAEDCSIFSGTVLKIRPLTKEANRDDSVVEKHTKVDVRIDEWLWNRRPDVGSAIPLDQTIVPENRRLGSEGRTVWDDVDVQVGGRLIVALRRNSDGPRKYVFVVSDVSLFPTIGVVLMWHRQFLTNPSLLVSVPELGGDNIGPLFLGYFASYLWRGGSFGNRDEEATALGKLLTSARPVAISPGLIRIALQHYLMSDSNPLSRAAQQSVTESLVIAASGEDLTLAEQAISLLIQLAHKGKLEMRPYLSADRTRRLSLNFRALVQAGKVDTNHAAFYLQLTGNR